MRVAGNQNIQPFYLTCGLNIFIQRASHIGIPHAGLAGRGAFVDQRDGQIDFTFKFINVTLQPLNFIACLNAHARRGRNRIIKSKDTV
ncbi:Uncharacterised protein [Salmonella enterica subsp. enterica serovar Bovismorbificans]|uniref:Uncharacterized protein n=1 Tax=Salmonella enterica subsp. enterica serovar Bovismorbificans TaxID=58097 RepID=A0A655C2J8_SALET|nr:Uncharacterised protein [Salmonella enterica subsp. enterica serovar Bovismorbificans]